MTVDACAGRLPTTLCLSVSDQRRDTAERASERERERAKERAREGEEARAHLGDGEEELLAELLVALVARGQVELCVHEQVVVSEWTLSEHEERREARERENERSEEGRESDARLKHVCALGSASLAAALWMLKRVTPLQGARRVSNSGEEERARGRDDALHLNPPSFQIALTFCLT